MTREKFNKQVAFKKTNKDHNLYFYKVNNKPVILFGTAWKEKMNALKTSFALTQQEIDSMYFASTPEEVMSLLTRLDSEFSDKKVKTGFEVDMRDEQGEKEGLLAA